MNHQLGDDSRTLIWRARPVDPTTKCPFTTAAMPAKDRCAMIVPRLDSRSRRHRDQGVCRSRTGIFTTIRRASGIVSRQGGEPLGEEVLVAAVPHRDQRRIDSEMRRQRHNRHHSGIKMEVVRLVVVQGVDVDRASEGVDKANADADEDRLGVARLRTDDRMHQRDMCHRHQRICHHDQEICPQHPLTLHGSRVRCRLRYNLLQRNNNSPPTTE